MGKVVVLSSGLLLASVSTSTTIPILSSGLGHAEAAKLVNFSKTSYQTTANLRLRTGTNTKSKTILTIPKGKTVPSSQKQGSWYKVSYTYKSKGKNVTKTGWVSGAYLKEHNIYTKTSGSYYFTKKTVKLYPEPNTKKKAVASLSSQNGLYSTQKVVNSIGQTWYRVSFNGKSLYTYSGDVSKTLPKSFAKKELQTKTDTYLYASYGSAFQKLVKLPKGTKISTTKSIGNWYAVNYKGKNGYVSMSYLQTVPPKVVKPKPDDNPVIPNEKKSYLVTADLNLRKSGEGTEILTTIPNGTTVTSSGNLNGWYQVTYNGKTGYVSPSYLKEYDLTENDYRFIDLRTKSAVTAPQINAYIAANYKRHGGVSVLLNKGQAFINAGNKFGVNALYLAAHAIHESGFGTSNISLAKNNIYGYGAYDATPFVGAYRFSSVEQCIDYVAQKVKADYLNPNGTHFEGAFLGYRTNDAEGTRVAGKSIGMNFWYASDSKWGNGIAGHMQKIMAFDKKQYQNPQIDSRYFSIPAIPAGVDQFPEGIQAVAKRDLSSIVKKDAIFNILEKSNDFKVKVLYNKKPSMITSISFSKYKDYISVLNLGRVVNASSVNVRSTPDTGNNIIGTFKLNQYVSLALDKKQKVIMDKSKNWYQVNVAKGKTGWVSKKYIVRELQ